MFKNLVVLLARGSECVNKYDQNQHTREQLRVDGKEEGRGNPGMVTFKE